MVVYLGVRKLANVTHAEDPATGERDDTQGGVRTRATRATRTMRAKRERNEREMENLQRHGNTEEPQRQVTTMVVYLGVRKLADDRNATHAEDSATGERDDAHGGTLEVTEDAKRISSQ